MNTMSLARHCVPALAAVLLGVGACPLRAQIYPYTVGPHAERGLLPNRAQLSGSIDKIDLKTGKMHLRVPLASLPRGPGGSGYTLALFYDSNLHDLTPGFVEGPPPNPERYPTETLKTSERGGWQYNIKYELIVERKEGASTESDCEPEHERQYRAWISLPDGSMHVLHLRGYDAAHGDQYYNDGWFGITPSGAANDCTVGTWPRQATGTLNYYTIDGSFLRLKMDATPDTSWHKVPWTLYFKDGSRAVSTTGWVADEFYDANDNRIRFVNVCNDEPECIWTSTQILDESDRALTIQRSDVSATEKTHTISAPGPAGPVTWTVNWEAITIGDDRQYTYTEYYNSLPLGDALKNLKHRIWTVQYIQLPLALAVPMPGPPATYNSYAFGYSDDDDEGFGQVDSIRTPGGAQYTYAWSLESASEPLTTEIVHENRVTTKTLTHSGLTGDALTWTFVRSSSPADLTVTAPTGAETVYDWDPADHGGLSRIEGPLGSVTKRVWSQNVPYGAHEGDSFIPANIYVSRKAVTVGDADGMPSKTAVTDYTVDKNGNRTGMIEYDWVPYSTSAVETGTVRLRTTALTYWVTTGAASVKTEDTGAYWHPSARDRLNAVRRRETGPSVVAVTEYEYDNAYTSGNLRVEKHWDDVKPASATAPVLGMLSPANAQVLTRDYDANGNLTDIYTPEIRTHITYDAAGNYPIQVDYGYQTPLERTWTYAWNTAAGTLRSMTDMDNAVTTTYGYDDVGRSTEVVEAGLRKTAITYDDQNRRVTTSSDLFTLGDGKLQTIAQHDMLGRVIETRVSDGDALSTDVRASDGIKVTTRYSHTNGSPPTVVTSTPYRSTADATLESTCTESDLRGRTIRIGVYKGLAPPTCPPTANRTGRTQMAYDADKITTTDPADVVVEHVHDALGRLTQATEDPGVGNLAYATTYAYDPLDNLTTVTQGVQTRSFVYSSLSRLWSATNPESGTTHYCYDDAGNLTSRTDARVVLPSNAYDASGNLICPANAAHATATYVYDDLQRLDTVNYLDTTLNVDYDYHVSGSPNIGQLKSIFSDAAKAIYDSYDTLGRVTSMFQTIAGHPDTFSFAATYYLNDALNTQTYPSGRMVTYDVDDAGRVEDVSDGTTTYADIPATAGHAYAPDGRLQRMKLGNNLWETRDYHTPGTPTLLKLVTPDEMTMLPGAIEQVALGYNYSGTANNGNLMSHTITRPGRTQPWTQTFTYDAANRLETARETGGYDREFGYDRYGNRWVKPHPVKPNNGMTQTDMHEPKYATQFDAAKNQLASPPMVDYYDKAGNQTMYSPYTLAYDAENRLKSMTHTTSGSATYLYDGEGRRVKKTWTPGGGTAEDTYYVYDIVGNLAAEYGTGTAPPSGTLYPFTDMLGSVRAVTDAAGAVIECYDYLPFGRMLSASDNGRMDAGCHPPSPDASLDSDVSQKFTGQLRDEETRLDYFNARYLSAPEGRFLSADPLSGWPGDTQSWNGYAYARNNPLLYTDPTGERYRICVDGGECFDVSDDEYWLYIAEFGTYGYGLPEHPTTPHLSCAASGSEEGRQHYCLTVVYRSPDPADLLIDVMGQRADTLNSVMNVAALGVLGAPAVGLAATAASGFAAGSVLTTLGQIGIQGARLYPATIMGYTLHSHAWTRMAQDIGHRIPSAVVEQVIRFGKTLPGRDPGITVKFLSSVHPKGVTVLLKESTKQILSIRIGAP